MSFREELLHFIWQFRLYDQLNLITVSGESLRILSSGQHNGNAGPDFEFAQIQIGQHVWMGHIEIHILGKDWFNHKHHLDERYNNTVLHVVWEHDREAIRQDGSVLPTLELRHFVDVMLIERYKCLMQNRSWIPCEATVKKLDDPSVVIWMQRLLYERMEQKQGDIHGLLEEYAYDWERVLLIVLGRSFGQKVNQLAFQTMMQRIDIALLRKYQGDLFKIEALLFGVSGLLPEDDCDDGYVSRLKAEFVYLQQLHGLQPLERTAWKFHRMRPYNFPTLRLAQLAALYTYDTYWFDKICNTDDIAGLIQIVQSNTVSSYWGNHFRFGVVSKEHSRGFSDDLVKLIFINAFVPLLFTYGYFMKDECYIEKSIRWLGQMDKEINAITKSFVKLGFSNTDAAESQTLLHLKQRYCNEKKCLSCAIGLAILKTN